eukprot:1141192-Pelagomonas_calceolata.AAC.2
MGRDISDGTRGAKTGDGVNNELWAYEERADCHYIKVRALDKMLVDKHLKVSEDSSDMLGACCVLLASLGCPIKGTDVCA